MHHSDQPILIAGGRALDPDGELDQPPVADILVVKERCSDRSGGFAQYWQEYRTIDARGMLVTPGFINAHYHSHDVLLRGMFEQMPLEVWGLPFPFELSTPER